MIKGRIGLALAVAAACMPTAGVPIGQPRRRYDPATDPKPSTPKHAKFDEARPVAQPAHETRQQRRARERAAAKAKRTP